MASGGLQLTVGEMVNTLARDGEPPIVGVVAATVFFVFVFGFPLNLMGGRWIERRDGTAGDYGGLCPARKNSVWISFEFLTFSCPLSETFKTFEKL